MPNQKKIIIIGGISVGVILVIVAGFYSYNFYRQKPAAPEQIVPIEEKELSAESKEQLGINPEVIATVKETAGGEDTLGPMQVITLKPTQASLDSDGDGLDDKREQELGINHLNSDTDGDGVEDGDEMRLGTNPLQADNPFKK